MPTLRKLFQRHPDSFDCPFCNQPVYLNTFPNHCSSKHDLDQQCVWCFGHVLRPTEKHLVACCERFIQSLPSKTPLTVPAENPTLLDLTPIGPSSDTPVSTHFKGLTYQSDSLNVAATYLRELLKNNADWFHLMVRDPAWPSVSAAIQEKSIQQLPFTCFCRGGGGYRHLIVTCQPKGRFMKSVWKTFLRAHVRKQMIESPKELVETLDRLSREKSTCDFTFQAGGEEALNHFKVALSLPRLHALLLAFEWDGGIIDWVHERYAATEASLLAPGAFLSSGLWVLKIRDLPGMENHWVLPVSKNLRPSEQKTKKVLHLHHGTQFYFEEGEEEEEEETWIKHQAERGNYLWNLIGDFLYFPTPDQQKCIGLIKMYAEDLEAIQNVFEEKLTEMKGLQESVSALRTRNKTLKRKFTASEKEFKLLQQKHIRYLEQENDQLRTKNENLKRKKIH